MDARTSPARIVVGVDGSESATQALAWALDEAALTGATVQAVHAWHYPALTYASVFASPPIFAREDFEAAAAQIVDRALSTVAPLVAAPVERLVVEGPATKTLVDRAHGADLLVVGHRGWGGIVGLRLGSVALQCAMHAECPVVVVRGDPHPARDLLRTFGAEWWSASTALSHRCGLSCGRPMRLGAAMPASRSFTAGTLDRHWRSPRRSTKKHARSPRPS